jgi:glycosyltransferase A (GT-A) superfamily protein (DUF2064 family)
MRGHGKAAWLLGVFGGQDVGLESVSLTRGYGAACVLNADSPTLPTASLVKAARHLLAPSRRAVLGPADDGGYWLLDMQSLEPSLYARIAWSTDAASVTTPACITALRLGPVLSDP